jgi:transcriptional antiterminator RfaH
MSKLNWYVLITKPRAEKKVAERLADLNLEVYCPVKIEMRQWSDRKKKVQAPLLPSMVLVRLTDAQRPLVFDVVGVVRYLFWLGEPAIVRELEIETLKEALDSGLTIVETSKIGVGDIIDIEGLGSVKKEKGKIKHISGKHCWVVMESLGYIVKLTI